MIKVLLIDGHDRRALACIRGLGREKGYEIHVGSCRKINATKYSKYCDNFFLYTDPEENLEEFIHQISHYIKNKKIKVLIPMGDNMASFINGKLKLLETMTSILQPKAEIFQIARDKEKTLVAADEIKVPIPRTYSYHEVIDDIDKIYFPLLIKPRISSASMGMVIVDNKESFKLEYEKVNKKYKNPLIQEYIKSGGGHYQLNAVLDYDSNVICSVVKNKLREFPIYGGPSTFFRTVDYPLIEEYGTNLLRHIKWVGPAEVEFMLDPQTKIPKLMEINPRMSATIALSIAVGVNFPKYITDFALGKPFKNSYKNQKYNYFCQWFIPGDFLNFIYNPRRFEQEYGYFGFFRKKLTHMTYDSEDIKPFFAYLIIMVSSFFSPKKIFRYLKRK